MDRSVREEVTGAPAESGAPETPPNPFEPASPTSSTNPTGTKSAAEAASAVPPAKRSSTIAWVASTYFAEGLPYSIVKNLSGVYFTDIGVAERYIGYTNFLGVPWNLKFLWAPFVDATRTKRGWMIAMQGVIAVLTAVVAAMAAAADAAADPSRFVVFSAMIFVGMAFFAATNDVAIDGYYLEALKNKGDQAAYSGYRVMAYRVAMVFARSGMVEVAAIAGHTLGSAKGSHLPWAYAFGASALAMGLVTAGHAAFLPKVERPGRGEATAGVEREAAGTPGGGPVGGVAGSPVRAALRDYARAFVSYLQQEKVGVVVLFMVVYKLGDEILFSMVSPFLLRELAVTKAQLAWISGVIGVAGSILGAMAGGHLIKKWGLRRAIWPLTLAMNLNIFAYCWLAWAKPDPTTASGIATIAFIHGYEQLAAGVGTAVLIVYILRTCHPDFKAAHFAIGTAIMSLGSTVVGGFGGWIVESIGYLNLFLLAFVASIPSMLLLLVVPLRDET